MPHKRDSTGSTVNASGTTTTPPSDQAVGLESLEADLETTIGSMQRRDHECEPLEPTTSCLPQPPSYESHSNLNARRRPGTKWLTIEWFENPVEPPFPPFMQTEAERTLRDHHSLDPSHTTPPSGPSSPSSFSPNPDIYNLHRVPELCQVVSNFQKTHLNLQGYAKALFDATNDLVGLKGQIMDIHEDWMGRGMHDMAHNLLPILDIAEEAMPRYTFPPAPNIVSPVM